MASPKPLSLGLQGGGVHAAFSWGVIDALLGDERVEISAVSASSGGALLGLLLAQGLMEGGAQGARDTMHAFWKKVSIATGHMPLRMKAVDNFLGHVGLDFTATSLALDTITRIFSPYQFNLFDINPLRIIVSEMVDFDKLARTKTLPLYINATHARTGRGKLFSGKDITLDAVMASCCLPYVFKTVEVGGEPYWDGSFSGCPPLSPLVNNSHGSDILIVQIHPSQVDDIPTTASDILDRATEISFNSVFYHELKTLKLYNAAITREGGAPVHLHRIEAEDMLGSLGRASKLNADWDFITYLHDLGVQAAEDWLEKHAGDIGRRATFDLGQLS